MDLVENYINNKNGGKEEENFFLNMFEFWSRVRQELTSSFSKV